MLIDTVEVELKAGKGGDGVIAWRREKFVPRGGPDGGDGGRGGDVILRASHNLDTLTNFRYRKVFQAENGVNGANKSKSGSSGQNLELLVPIGTKVTNLARNQVVVDLDTDEETFIIAHGGRGGLGNVHFKSATNQNPFQSTQGQSGESLKVRLELQLVADIAIIGQPSVGKSSIIKALTGIEARIGAYDFSTTEPILGVLRAGDQSLTLVDLPGLIEGAHQGKGLGHHFLKHTQRVKALLHVLDGTDSKIEVSEKAILDELKKYDPSLSSKTRVNVINKSDLLTAEEKAMLQKRYPKAIVISAATGDNLGELRERLLEVKN